MVIAWTACLVLGIITLRQKGKKMKSENSSLCTRQEKGESVKSLKNIKIDP